MRGEIFSLKFEETKIYNPYTHMATMQQHRNPSKYSHTEVTWA